MKSSVRTMAIFAVVMLVSLFAISQDRGVAGMTGARVALLIGNSAYKIGPLKNPVNDANDMAVALKKCGFRVIARTDCDLRAMKEALDNFAKDIPGCEAALFFFAGHGMQVGGRNYLVPVDASPTAENEVEFECLDAGRVLAKLEIGGAQVNIVILDACRNNPLSRSWRSANQGLTNMDAPKGSIILFATAPGSLASDGEGSRNGIYTGCLLKHLATPGLPIEQVFKRTAADVQRETQEVQSPWLSSSLTGDFCFTVEASPTIASKPETVTSLPPPPSAPALVGGLQVSVNVSKARVKVDGRDAGEATLQKALNISGLPAGDVEVEVTAEGYAPLNKTVAIKEGIWAQEPFKLTKTAYFQGEMKPAVEHAAQVGDPQMGEVRTFSGIDFCWIPAGNFMMGSENGPDDERPMRQVTIAHGFWLGKTEVTQAQWQAVMGSNPSKFAGNADSPVEQVSWEECQAFILRLNDGGQGVFRLPSEAEWEYACRAGSAAVYCFGNYESQLGEYAWYNGSRRVAIHAVAGKRANAWGLYDMHGNVWEWCQDWYHKSYQGAPSDGSVWVSSTGQRRVTRGGSWFDTPGRCRSASRGSGDPSYRFEDNGFRLLRTP